MHNVPDPIEQGESSAERWADENICGDNFTCYCGRQCKLSEGVALSPNPFCIPVCPLCAMKDPAYVRFVTANALRR